MAAVAMRMPPHLQSTATLATLVVDAEVPHWAASRAAVTLSHGGAPEAVAGRRSERDVFRLPNSSKALRDWLYTRPDVEAVDEDAFTNCAIESSTIFRIESIHKGTIEISPTVSNHWLMVPVQSINGVTVGLTYLDVLYQRKDPGNCVPPLRNGKFAIDDSTGEVFLTGWTGGIMVVGWIQSIIKCERVRELHMYEAPPVNGLRPHNLLMRNSFYERRDCRLCGIGRTLDDLDHPPCSGSGTGLLSQEASSPRPLTNVASLYRRFRGGYFGVCLKTAYSNGRIKEQDLVPVFVDLKHGLPAVKQRFRLNLQRNCDYPLDCLFGLHPRASSRLFFLKTEEPVSSFLELCNSPCGKRKASEMGNTGTAGGSGAVNRIMTTSPMSSVEQDMDAVSSDRSCSPPSRTRRRVGVDEVNRESIEFERKRRNRIAAQRSNRLRKQKLEREREELRRLNERRVALQAREDELAVENFELKMRLGGRSGG